MGGWPVDQTVVEEPALFVLHGKKGAQPTRGQVWGFLNSLGRKKMHPN